MTQERPNADILRLCRIFPDSFAPDKLTAWRRCTKYHMERVIGCGTRGVVFTAIHIGVQKRYAVRLIDFDGMTASERAKAQSEVYSLLNCDCCSIVKCHETMMQVDEQDPNTIRAVALVLDYLPCGTLHLLIRRHIRNQKALSEQMALHYFIQVLMAVHHVHSKHMIHRDIKSANILLGTNHNVKLSEFGFCKAYTNTVSENVASTFAGTPHYIAPEIWRHRPYSKKADMFSLGVLLYELLTLRVPFDGNPANQIEARVCGGQYEPLPSNLTPELSSLVGRLLQVDPVARPTTEDVLRTPICCVYLNLLATRCSLTSGDAQILDDKQLAHEAQQLLWSLAETGIARPRTRENAEGGSAAALSDGDDTPLPSVAETVTRRQCGPFTALHSARVMVDRNYGFWEEVVLHLCEASAEVVQRMPSLFGSFEEPRPLADRPTFLLLLDKPPSFLESRCVAIPFDLVLYVLPVPPMFSSSQPGRVFTVVLRSPSWLAIQVGDVMECEEWIARIRKIKEKYYNE
jgi:serine/threonine protein kinase